MPRKADASSAVVRALDVLVALKDQNELSIREISARVGLPKTTVHRILLALESRLFVTQSPETERYRLGPRLVEIGHAAGRWLRADQEALAALRRIARTTGETAQLAELNFSDVVFQESITETPGLHVSMPRGSRLPAYASAFGKVLLANMPIAETFVLLENMPDDASRGALLAELPIIRRTGIAIDNNSAAPQSIGIASPIFDYTDRVVSSIGIHAPAERLDDAMKSRVADLVRTSARAVSVRLGHSASSEVWHQLANERPSAVEPDREPPIWEPPSEIPRSDGA